MYRNDLDAAFARIQALEAELSDSRDQSAELRGALARANRTQGTRAELLEQDLLRAERALREQRHDDHPVVLTRDQALEKRSAKVLRDVLSGCFLMTPGAVIAMKLMWLGLPLGLWGIILFFLGIGRASENRHDDLR
ncbi:MAG TPA: hypothetical protein VGC41_26895 [Kofleriaceae bacterium]